MIRVFCGYDPREALGFHTFCESLIRQASEPVSIIPLHGQQKDGTNAFTYARFLVPSLCDFKGMAIFLDASDMLMRGDIVELAKLYDPKYAVQVVKHDYWTKHPTKYAGTEMEAANKNYPRKNWSSVVIWNCGAFQHQWMEPGIVQEMSGTWLHRFSWLHEENNEIGTLPPEWNVLIGEGMDTRDVKIAHFTIGIPAIDEYRHWEFADEWHAMANHTSRVPQGKSLTVSV